MGRVRTRGSDTTAAIESAVLDLALAAGYENVTVDDICAAVGISQRTFFNHFRTKDDALLGSDLPRIDERAARRFILSEGPLLSEAIALVTFNAPSANLARLGDRIGVISTSPALMARQMERMSALESELLEIIGLRLHHQDPQMEESRVEQIALMVSHLLAGIMRYLSSAGDGGETIDSMTSRAQAILADVIERS